MDRLRHPYVRTAGPLALKDAPAPPDPPSGPDEAPGTWPDDAPEAAGGEGGRIVCRACGTPVTTAGLRRTAAGAHRHVFHNPHGIVFEVGCFSAAPGAVPEGPATTEFTWFPGHAWRVALCRGCAAHLGWRFSGGGDAFWGLILPRLAEEEGDDAG